MDQESLRRAIAGMEGVAVDEAMDAFFFFYDPEGINPANQTYPFATLVTTAAHDQASDLDRPGVYRLNVGVSRGTYRSLFPADAEHDFTTLDRLMPHPVSAARRGSAYSARVTRRSSGSVRCWPRLTNGR